MKPIAGNGDIARRWFHSFEPHRHPVIVLIDAGAFMPKLHCCCTQPADHRVVQYLMQIGAMDREMGIFVARIQPQGSKRSAGHAG